MNPIVMGLTALLVFQLVGEVIAYLTGGLVPGPVIGMALIFVAMMALSRSALPRSARPQAFIDSTTGAAKALIGNFGVLFVPAGVGIMQHLDLLADRGVALLVTVVLTTVTTLAVTVWTFLIVKRLLGRGVHGQ